MPDSSGLCKLFPCQTTQRISNRKHPGFKLSTVNLSNAANVDNGLPRLHCFGVSFIHLNLNHCVENFWTNSIQLFFNESQWSNADTWKVPVLLCLCDEETQTPQWEMLLFAVKDMVFPNTLTLSLTKPSEEREKKTMQPLMPHISKEEWRWLNEGNHCRTKIWTVCGTSYSEEEQKVSGEFHVP